MKVDLNKVARALGGDRRGKVAARGGYFGAIELAAEVSRRFRVPPRGGRATDPRWTDKRLIPLAPETLAKLEALTKRMREKKHVALEPMQLAAMLVEQKIEELSDADE